MSRKKPKRTVPRRVRTITEEELPPEIEHEPTIDNDLLELESFFQQLGDENIRYKLYRVEKGGKRVWLEDASAFARSDPTLLGKTDPPVQKTHLHTTLKWRAYGPSAKRSRFSAGRFSGC